MGRPVGVKNGEGQESVMKEIERINEQNRVARLHRESIIWNDEQDEII